MMNELLTADELATLLKISRASLYNLTHQQRIPFLKIDRRLRFDPKAIQVWLDRRSYKVEQGSPR